VVGGAVLKILAYAELQLLRFADIDDHARFIFHEINAGFHRERQCFLLQPGLFGSCQNITLHNKTPAPRYQARRRRKQP
jgi:hypothetical protein